MSTTEKRMLCQTPIGGPAPFVMGLETPPPVRVRSEARSVVRRGVPSIGSDLRAHAPKQESQTGWVPRHAGLSYEERGSKSAGAERELLNRQPRSASARQTNRWGDRLSGAAALIKATRCA